MATNRHLIKSYFNDEENTHLSELASRLRLSRSELIRRLVTGQRLPDPNDFVAYQAVRDVLKVNADLARLGNLLKLALDDQNWRGPDGRNVEALIGDIAVTQKSVKAAAQAVAESVQR
jgi:hypothetical protein